MISVAELTGASAVQSPKQAVTAPVRFSSHVTVDVIARIMGLPVDRFEALAWLVMQEEAAGVARETIAAELETGVEEVEALIESVTGLSGAEAQQLWSIGIIALRTASHLNEHTINRGWDTVEALAINKLAEQLATMRGNGDADQMLRIAAAANKAIRRSKGEGNGMKKFGDAPPSGATVTLQSGDLGTMSLTFSPAIQAQLGNPNRVIEGVASNAKKAGENSLKNLSMLGLNETRGLVDSKAEVKSEQQKISDAFDKLFEIGESLPDA